MDEIPLIKQCKSVERFKESFCNRKSQLNSPIPILGSDRRRLSKCVTAEFWKLSIIKAPIVILRTPESNDPIMRLNRWRFEMQKCIVQKSIMTLCIPQILGIQIRRWYVEKQRHRHLCMWAKFQVNRKHDKLFDNIQRNYQKIVPNRSAYKINRKLTYVLIGETVNLFSPLLQI